jgi:hypothetical protein
MLLAVAAPFAHNPPQTGQDKPIEQKLPVKRVRVDLSGFELGKTPPPKPSTQIGGGTRTMGGETTLLGPAIGRCYSATPVLAWTHTAQVQTFELRLFDQAGTLVHRMTVVGRQVILPPDHQLEPGGTLQWSVQPGSAVLGGASARSTIKRLSAAELAEVSQQLTVASPGAADPQEWSAQVFTDHRLWYDAIAAWSDLIQRFPNRADLREKRGQVYDQLPPTQPLADEDFAVAEKLRAGRAIRERY